MLSLNHIKFSKFKVNFNSLGVFPKIKFLRIVWIGTDMNSGKSLIKLAKKVEKTLIPLGFSVDKLFKPHITVFRIKNKIGDIRNELDKFKTTDFGTKEITEFKLKQSILNSKGSIYTDLMEINAEL